MTKAKQIEEINNKIAVLLPQIKELDLWFIANVSAQNWNEKINHYWVLQAKVEDLRMQRQRLKAGKHRLIKQHMTYSIPNQTNPQL